MGPRVVQQALGLKHLQLKRIVHIIRTSTVLIHCLILLIVIIIILIVMLVLIFLFLQVGQRINVEFNRSNF